jgi:hypothetical protein
VTNTIRQLITVVPVPSKRGQPTVTHGTQLLLPDGSKLEVHGRVSIQEVRQGMNQATVSCLCQAWRTKADDLLRISKSYKCRSTEVLRTAYVKQAAQLRMCADELEAANAEAMAQGARAPEVDGQAMASSEGTDTAEGQVPVPAVPRRRPYTRGNRGGSHDPLVEGRDGQAVEPSEPVQ